MDPPSSSVSTSSPLNTPAPPPTSQPVVATLSSSSDGLDGPVLVLTDGNGLTYTTTVYSTQNPSPTTASTPASDLDITNTNGLGAILAAFGGGVGLLLLLVGLTWFIRVRRAKRRAGISVIKDRKFYPDRYNQTVTSNRHSEYNEIEPGPVVVQPPPPLLSYQTLSRSSDRLSRQIPAYPCPRTRGNWAGAPPDGVLEDIPPLTRLRVPYPSSPSQPLVDRYTMLSSRSTSNSNAPTTSSGFVSNPPPNHPRHFRSSHHTHRRYHSHHVCRDRPQHQGHGVERDSYFPPSLTLNPSPMRMARRNTILVSPPMTPSSFSAFSDPPPYLPITRIGPTTATLTSQPSLTRSTFSSANHLAVVNDVPKRKRMMCTNPDLDVDLETDTEPDEPGRGGSGGSPSATDIIRLYDKDWDRDTSPTNSVIREKDPSTVSITPLSMSTKNN